MVISDQGRLLQVNSAFEQTLGYTVDDLAPAPFESVPPEDLDRLREPIKELTEGRGPVRFENRTTGAQQRLVSLKLKLRLTVASVPPEEDDLKSMLSEAVSDANEVFQELRKISRGIHLAILSAGGLPWAFKALARRSSVPVELDVVIEQRLPDSIEVAGY